MNRALDMFRVLFDLSFWNEFIELDMREETRMMHDW